MKKKTVVLAAVNAKYIHSNLAVYSLRANAGKYAPAVQICEYTVNQRREEILASIYEKKPDMVGFSCYLWNIEYVASIARNLKKVLPDVRTVAGGPEVSFRPESFLEENPAFDIVITGEGERTFRELLGWFLEEEELEEEELAADSGAREKRLSEIRGLVYRVSAENPGRTGEAGCLAGASGVQKEGKTPAPCPGGIRRTLPREGIPMDELVFPYSGALSGMENRILYYESIRGCPFSCSYCLSSVGKTVRVKSTEKTCEEIEWFLQRKVPLVKFVDRTFNCNHEHAYRVWEYLSRHDNNVTGFHFEIAGDLFREEDFALFEKMRPGLVQFEIGVQSTNPETIRAVRRTMDLEKLRENLEKIRGGRNIHVHLDLIAGLPFEDYASFRNSFNDVYAMRPDKLQLGFLKLLEGSYMSEKQTEYGIVCSSHPPYEVLSTDWLSYGDVLRLKQVEEMVEVYYNSSQFAVSVSFLLRYFPDAFSMYWTLGQYYAEQRLFERKHDRISRYRILWDFAGAIEGIDRELFRQALTIDLYSRDYVKNPPGFVRRHSAAGRDAVREYLLRASGGGTLPHGYGGIPLRQLVRMIYVDTFTVDVKRLQESGEVRAGEPVTVLFDYKNRSPLTRSASLVVCEEVLQGLDD